MLAFCLLVASPEPAGAIVNGAAASDATFQARFPWAVALVSPESGGVCTAQLVAPEWLLTAGHCTSEGWEVRVGHAERSAGTLVAIAGVVRHPLYDPENGDYDVGLIRLATPQPYPVVPLVARREAGELLREGARAVIAGWGRRLPALPHAERLVVSDVELRGLRREKGRIVYFDPVSGPCGGDSGGPLLVTRADGTAVLAGVASRVVGDLCAQRGGTGIYMDVAEVLDFIASRIGSADGR